MLSIMTIREMFDHELEAYVNTLNNEQRKTLREKLETDTNKLPRNLYFNYETQEWIE